VRGARGNPRPYREPRSRRQHRAEHQIVERRQPPAGAAHPVAQRRSVQRDALALQHLGLPIKRQRIAELADQHMHDQRLGRHATVDWPRRCLCHHHRPFAGAAGIARTARDPQPLRSCRRHWDRPQGRLNGCRIRRQRPRRSGLQINLRKLLRRSPDQRSPHAQELLTTGVELSGADRVLARHLSRRQSRAKALGHDVLLLRQCPRPPGLTTRDDLQPGAACAPTTGRTSALIRFRRSQGFI
jgi:hypothetical protein